MKKDMVWCKSCERWLPPSYYDKKTGKPAYIHSCYSAKELRELDALTITYQKLPKHWGEIRMVKPRKRAVKPNKGRVPR
jgi:hypothetical protein